MNSEETVFQQKQESLFITPFESAVRQFETASNLIIDFVDVVSEYVLACASAEVLNRILKCSVHKSIFEELKLNNNLLGPTPFNIISNYHESHNMH